MLWSGGVCEYKLGFVASTGFGGVIEWFPSVETRAAIGVTVLVKQISD